MRFRFERGGNGVVLADVQRIEVEPGEGIDRQIQVRALKRVDGQGANQRA